MNEVNNLKIAKVSLFKSYTDKTPIDIISLYDWVTATQFADEVRRIRSFVSDKKRQNELKSKLPCITPSGIFSYCKDSNLDKHSGFICVDIDGGESNPKLKDKDSIESIKKSLGRKLPFLAYCGLSVSGKGLYCLFPIKYPEKHLQHYFALEEMFSKIGLNIDPACKNVSRLRGASFDENPFINLNAVPFTKTIDKSVIRHKLMFTEKSNQVYTNGEIHTVPHSLVVLIKAANKYQIDITGDRKRWFAIGCALAYEYGENGRWAFHEFSKHYKTKQYHYTPEETDLMYNNCLKAFHRYSYTIYTLYYWCKYYGLYDMVEFE